MLDGNERKFKIRDLIQIPKRERSQRHRKKCLLHTSFLVLKIRPRLELCMRHHSAKRLWLRPDRRLLKKVPAEEKETRKKKKIICRADTVKVRQLPTAVTGVVGVEEGVGVGGGVLLMHQSCNFEV